MTRYEHHYYGGDWQKPIAADNIDVVSSATEEAIGRVPRGTKDDVDRAVAALRLRHVARQIRIPHLPPRGGIHDVDVPVHQRAERLL